MELGGVIGVVGLNASNSAPSKRTKQSLLFGAAYLLDDAASSDGEE